MVLGVWELIVEPLPFGRSIYLWRIQASEPGWCWLLQHSACWERQREVSHLLFFLSWEARRVPFLRSSKSMQRVSRSLQTMLQIPEGSRAAFDLVLGFRFQSTWLCVDCGWETLEASLRVVHTSARGTDLVLNKSSLPILLPSHSFPLLGSSIKWRLRTKGAKGFTTGLWSRSVGPRGLWHLFHTCLFLTPGNGWIGVGVRGSCVGLSADCLPHRPLWKQGTRLCTGAKLDTCGSLEVEACYHWPQLSFSFNKECVLSTSLWVPWR